MTGGHDIIAIIGASNGLGLGKGPFEYRDNAPANTIFEVYEPEPGDIRIAERTTDPITSSYTLRGGGRTGMIVSFCRGYANMRLAANRRVVFINPCMGGCFIEQWGDPPSVNPKFKAKPCDLYIQLKRRLCWALALPGSNRVAHLLLQIGENDINWIENGNLPEDYLLHAIPELVARVRREFGSDIPVTIGEPQQDWQHDRHGRPTLVETIHAAQRAIPNSAFVSSAGLARNPVPELKHFNAQAAVELGSRHFDAMQMLTSQPAVPSPSRAHRNPSEELSME